MTDLDGRLDLLRADLRSRITPSPLAALLVPGGARRWNRFGAALVAAALVVLIVTGSLLARSAQTGRTRPAGPQPILSTSERQTPATTPDRTDTSTTASPAVAGGAEQSGRSVPTLEMADAKHGFALVQRCKTEGTSCRTTLSVTQDGLHWAERTAPAGANVPADPGADDVTWPALTALGPRSVFYQAGPGGTGSGHFSDDGGVSWVSVPAGVNGSVASIPSGGVLQASCPRGGSDPCTTVALTVRLPGNGHLVKLVHQPDIVVQSAAPPLPDGSWWVTGTKGGRPAMAVSRDRGRTWAGSRLPAVAGQYLFTSAVTAAGGRLWALAIGQLPEVKNGLLGIYRSDDNGKTWLLPWKVGAGVQPRTALGVGIAFGRRLLICDEGLPQHGWVSADGAHSFGETACPGKGWTQWSTAGYLSSDGTSWSMSADGMAWARVGP